MIFKTIGLFVLSGFVISQIIKTIINGYKYEDLSETPSTIIILTFLILAEFYIISELADIVVTWIRF